jgi:hypothetical protein
MTKHKKIVAGLGVCFLSICLSGCGKSNPSAPHYLWAWMGGSNAENQLGTYPASLGGTGTPGARDSAVTWVDKAGNFWLFGGAYYNGSTSGLYYYHYLNDTWKFDGTAWTWVAGSKLPDQQGTYPGAIPGAGTPGARAAPAFWVDSAGHLWMFGGFGVVGGGAFPQPTNYLDEIWEFDGSAWTTVLVPSGSMCGCRSSCSARASVLRP